MAPPSSPDPDLDAQPEPEDLVGKDELDEDDEMELSGDDLVDDEEDTAAEPTP